MKRLFMAGVLILALFVTASGWAANLRSIGNTADASITTGTGYLKGIILHTDGTNSVTVSIYDSTAASGSKLVSSLTITTSSTNRTSALGFGDREVPYFTGIYVDITTSGSVTYDVYFESM